MADRHVISTGQIFLPPSIFFGDFPMSENSGGGTNSFLAFVVGGLVVAVGVLAFLYFGIHVIGPKATSTTTVTAPSSTGGTTTNSTTTTTP